MTDMDVTLRVKTQMESDHITQRFMDAGLSVNARKIELHSEPLSFLVQAFGALPEGKTQGQVIKEVTAALFEDWELIDNLQGNRISGDGHEFN